MKTVSLGECITLVNGRAYKQKELLDKGTPVLRIQNLNGGNNWYYSDLALPENKYCVKGDLLFAWSATFGPYKYMGPKSIYHYHIWKIIPFEHIIDKEFSYYLLLHITKDVKDKAHGISMLHITKSKMEAMLISLPSIETQKKIAAILDAADNYRQKTKILIEKYDQLAKALFLDMFGDPVTNTKGLKVVKLDDITTKITDGVHAKPNYTEKGVPFISVKDITTGTLKFEKCKYISKEDHEKYTRRCKPELNDILYTKVGATYGRPAIINTKNEFSIYVSVALIKPLHEKINSIFLKEAMANPAIKRQADKSIKGIGVPDLHLNMIKKFLIPYPSLTLQNQFADRIQLIEQQKQQAQASLQKAEDLFNSLLQRAFKGELVS